MKFQHKFKFRKTPTIIENFFIRTSHNQNIKIDDLITNAKKSSFKIGNTLASLWFGAILFALQSYFLRQNLKLTNNKFISD